MLSQTIKQHMLSPRNMGVIPTPDGVGDVLSSVCGDQFVIYLQIEGDRIKRASFTTHGCWAAVAMGSLITDVVVGKSTREALILAAECLARDEANLPPEKWPCARLVSQALYQAVLDWQRRTGRGMGLEQAQNVIKNEPAA